MEYLSPIEIKDSVRFLTTGKPFKIIHEKAKFKDPFFIYRRKERKKNAYRYLKIFLGTNTADIMIF